MRTNLITTLHCAECGNKLHLITEAEYSKKNNRDTSCLNESPQLPTGAAMHHIRVSVAPCRYCIEKHTGPAKALAAAVKELTRN